MQNTPDKAHPVHYPNIGHLAKWSVSSYKFGFGPECLTDGDPETFWQSVTIKNMSQVKEKENKEIDQSF